MIDEPQGRWGTLVALSLVVVLALVPWFSAAAVAPLIAAEWQIDGLQTALLTVAVQVGFAIGALVLALTGAADVIPARRLVAGEALPRQQTRPLRCSRSTSSRRCRCAR